MHARRRFWRWTLAVMLPLLFRAGLGCAEVAGIYLPADESCRNGVRDPEESGVDCGGPCVGACTGETCEDDRDCASGKCDDICRASRCNDGIWNGMETTLDVCAFRPPEPFGPCEDNFCFRAPCYDNVKNGTETDVDCGGKDCRPCGDNKVCIISVDCTSHNCVDHLCACAPCSSFVNFPMPRFGTMMCSPELVGEFISCVCRGACEDACGTDCRRRGTPVCEACIKDKCADVGETCSKDK